MSVHFVHCELANAVKIGFAADPWKRFSKIQSDTPGRLRLLAIEDGDQEREAELHRQFAPFRTRGEWFQFSRPIQRHVESLPVPKRAKTREPLGGALGKWMADNGVSLRRMSELTDINIASLSRACSGQGIPNKASVQRIYVLTGGAVQPNDFYDLPQLPSEN